MRRASRRAAHPRMPRLPAAPAFGLQARVVPLLPAPHLSAELAYLTLDPNCFHDFVPHLYALLAAEVLESCTFIPLVCLFQSVKVHTRHQTYSSMVPFHNV